MTAQDVLNIIENSANHSLVQIPSFYTFLGHPGLLPEAYQMALRKQIDLNFAHEKKLISTHDASPLNADIITWSGYLAMVPKEIYSYIDWLQNHQTDEVDQMVCWCTNGGC